jgi:histidyl-tRNA synthetase
MASPKPLVKAVKGMNDVLPADIGRWHAIEAAFREAMERLGYREMRTPYVEHTPLFSRAIGEATDVVEKEMYSFTHHDDALTLRPEGTAGAVRAFVEHNVANTEPLTRWYYIGPMFRAERPQAGRYRQFYQVGAECFGDPGPGCDAEMIDGLVEFLKGIGIASPDVFISTIGGLETRAKYRDQLIAHLERMKDKLSPDSQRRLAINPLRVLDSKHPLDQEAIATAPSILDHLVEADRAHWDELRRQLDALGTPYQVDAKIVRGLDYYARTLFEIKGAYDKLGAGSTLAGGGRYDGMVKTLGGPDVPAIGFAAGLERLLIASSLDVSPAVVDVFVAPIGSAAFAPALVAARDIRRAGKRVECDTRGAGMKALLRRAENLGARVALILGEAELADGTITVKDLAARTQEKVARADVAARVSAILASPAPSST